MAVIRRSSSSERRFLVHVGSVIVVLLFSVCSFSVACSNAVAASNGNLLLKDVSMWNADVPWTEVVPGMEVMVHGSYHNVTMVIATKDPLTVHVVLDSNFHGVIGLRTNSSDLGVATIIEEDHDMQVRFVGTMTLAGDGTQLALNGVESMRTVGTITVTAGGLSQSVDVNLLVLVGFSDGQIVSTRVGVPMGWPFQLLPS